jgi:PKD repeat protein
VTNAAGSDSETKTGYITVTGWEPKNYGYWYRNETKTFAPNSSDAVTVCAGYDLCGPGQSCWVYVNGYGGYSGGTDWLPVQTEWLDWYLAPFPTLHVFAYCYSGGTYVNAGYFGYWDINLTEYYADPPSCSFTAEPGSGAAPLEVTFTDTSTNATSWSWDFGDGNTSADQNPQHTYAFAGNFTASLTVSNYWGSDSAEKYILVGSSPPVADFTATPTNGARPLTVQFTDTSTGSPTSWEWDFDNDGTVDSNAQNPEHVYSDAGVYSVNLTVTNSAGSDSMIRQSYITVTTGTTTYTVFVEGINEYHGTQDPLTSAIDIANTFHDNIVGSINNGAVWEDYYEFYDDNTGSKHWTVSESSLIKADYADFALFAGHGEHDRIYFGTQNNVLEPTLSDMSFGESKLKWLTFSACKVLNESTWTDWKPVFNGLHILNGYDTLGWLNGTQGGIYAAYLKGGTYGGDLYPLRNIRDGWMYTLKDTIYINDAYYNGAWMWAEPCGGDYLPGYGEFCTFPTKDSNGNYTVLYDKFDCV